MTTSAEGTVRKTFRSTSRDTHSSSRSVRVRDIVVDIHKCVCLVELGTDNVSCSLDPIILPSGFLEVM